MTQTKLQEPYDITDDEAKEFCLKYWESEIDNSDTMQGEYDWWVHEETSADGYTIWVAKYEDGQVWPSESVFYYADGLDEIIWECLRTGGKLRISDSDYEELDSQGLFDWQEKYAGIYELELQNIKDEKNINDED